MHFSGSLFGNLLGVLEMHKGIYSFFDLDFNSIKLAQGILKQILNGLSFLGSRIGILKLHLLALQTCKP